MQKHGNVRKKLFSLGSRPTKTHDEKLYTYSIEEEQLEHVH